MIRAITIIYIFFILCDIQLTVENYFQKIGSPPPSEKIHSLFLLTPPKNNSKSASPSLLAYSPALTTKQIARKVVSSFFNRAYFIIANKDDLKHY